jgi:hypothetical protein
MEVKDRPARCTVWMRVGTAASRLHGSTMSDVIGRQPRQQLTCLGLLAAPLLIPIAIPGMSTTVGALCLVVAISTLLKRPVQLPLWMRERRLPSTFGRAVQTIFSRITALVGRFSKPRLLSLSRPENRFLNGTMLALAGASMMVPVPVVSFDNVVPAAAVVLLAWGLRARDGGMLILGYITTFLAWIYVFVLWWAGAEIVLWLYHSFLTFFPRLWA